MQTNVHAWTVLYLHICLKSMEITHHKNYKHSFERGNRWTDQCKICFSYLCKPCFFRSKEKNLRLRFSFSAESREHMQFCYHVLQKDPSSGQANISLGPLLPERYKKMNWDRRKKQTGVNSHFNEKYRPFLLGSKSFSLSLFEEPLLQLQLLAVVPLLLQRHLLGSEQRK